MQLGKGSVKCVLLIEDHERLLHSFVRSLRSAGRTAFGARSRAEALDHLEQQPQIDLVVADYLLEGDNGLDVIDALRTKRSTLPAVILSGMLSESVLNDAQDRGVRCFRKAEPGANTIRELIDVVECGPSAIDCASFPSPADAERQYYISLVAAFRGNISKAARAIGTTRNTIKRKLKKAGGER